MSDSNLATQKSETEFTIEGLDHQGRGIAKLKGKTVFVEGALVGEKVIAKIRKKHRRFLQAETLEVISASADRESPVCPHFSMCGGCRLQHFSPEKQLQIKQHTLMEQLQHFAGTQPKEIMEAMTGPALHYRRKARLAVRYVAKRDEVLVGFHEKFSPFVTDMTSCPILDESVSEKISALRELIRSLEAFQKIPQIEVSVGDAHETFNTALIIRNLITLSAADEQVLKEFAELHGFRLFLQPKEEGNLTSLWPENSLPDMAYQIPAEELTLSFHPQNFIQVNAAVNQKMIALALQELEISAQDRVLDLFCGIGNFSLPLAKYASNVVGVEADDVAICRARRNAEDNQISNAEFFCANLFATEFEESEQSWFFKEWDKILLDPPRAGAQAMIDVIHRFNAKRIVYISCNPATLARDTSALIQQGYQLTKAGIIDLFPHTAHVEAIAVFDRI